MSDQLKAHIAQLHKDILASDAPERPALRAELKRLLDTLEAQETSGTSESRTKRDETGEDMFDNLPI